MSSSASSDPHFGANPQSDPVAWQRHLLGQLEAGSFPHAVDSIALIETHISFVLLTGRFAYKFKKAVGLGFLDFSTLERRYYFCQEELRLNRRLASAMYLDVVSIGGTQEVPQIGGSLPTLEYAVRMMQFDQHNLFDHLLAHGEVESADIDALARLVADFHQRLPPAQTPEERAHGTPASVLAPMEDNVSALRQLTGQSEGFRVRLDQLADWSRRQFAARQDELESRHRTGFVRECHGDLHLGNIVRLAEGPSVFDCIEFNPGLRWIDVVSEIAFLVMDLSERGRPDFAYRFLNAYLEQTGDYQGLGLLPFYLVYRATVRAKIAGIRAGQPSLAPADRVNALAQVQAYLEYAQRCTTAKSPILVITHGVSGSGKTWASQSLLEKLPAIRLRSDVERKRVHGLPPLASSGSGLGTGLYDASASVTTYKRLRELARSVVTAGFSVIVDASFLQRWQRDLFQELADELRVRLIILHCEAQPSTLYERVAARRHRGDDASEAGPDVLTRQLQSADPLAADEPSIDLAQALEVLTNGHGEPKSGRIPCRDAQQGIEGGDDRSSD